MRFTRGLQPRTPPQAHTHPALVPGANGWILTALLPGGEAPIMLPQPRSGGYVAMDPSNPKTWHRPVRWT